MTGRLLQGSCPLPHICAVNDAIDYVDVGDGSGSGGDDDQGHKMFKCTFTKLSPLSLSLYFSHTEECLRI